MIVVVVVVAMAAGAATVAVVTITLQSSTAHLVTINASRVISCIAVQSEKAS